METFHLYDDKHRADFERERRQHAATYRYGNPSRSLALLAFSAVALARGAARVERWASGAGEAADRAEAAARNLAALQRLEAPRRRAAE